MPKQLIIDGKAIEVEDGITLIQACEQAGVEIPRFCYHERLSIAGNCRMCLIEVAGMPKPVASCAMGVNDLPPNKDGSPKVIHTTSPMVKKAREGVMEFLLINHPLDCPICDQGGECDLQDQAMAYGVGGSRYAENKRAVDEKYLGPLIKTDMTRCIQCTRCVRYMTEVAGVEELGAIGRGEDMEITTYLERGMMSEMSANVVDLCPVGALTHRPWAFAARPWELRKTESIDVMDALGSAIRVDCRGREVVRILPRNNDAVNEEWISDKTRHVADGLRTQRLDRPYIRKSGRLEPAGWDEALALVALKLKDAKPDRIAAIAGDLAGAEEMFALKDLLARLGSENVECRQDGAKLDPKLGRASYLFNSTIEGIEQADAILLIGTNPAARGGRAQRAHPQALAAEQRGDRADRRTGRPHLSVRLPWRRSADAEGCARRQAQLRRACCATPSVRWSSSAPLRPREPTARPSWRQRPRSRCWRRKARTPAGTRSTSCTPRPRASPASTSGFVPGKGEHRSWPRWTSPISWAPTSSTWSALRRPSSSIRAAMAMPAPSAPTSCCRAPPTPRRAPPT